MTEQDMGKTSLGMEPNLAAMLCYLFGCVTGVIFYVIEKNNKFVRFHAMQSIVTFGALFVLQSVAWSIPGIGAILVPLIFMAQMALWIILMIKAYQGEKFKLPVVGNIAEKNN